MPDEFELIPCNMVFVWDEDSNYVEEIILVDIDKSLMVDINKKYDIYLKEIK